MALLLLNVICDYFRCVKSMRFLVMPGQNPMMAYVVGDLLIMPLVNLLGIASLLVYFNEKRMDGIFTRSGIDNIISTDNYVLHPNKMFLADLKQ